MSLRLPSLLYRVSSAKSRQLPSQILRCFSLSSRRANAAYTTDISALKVDADRLCRDIHHTCQWGTGERWGEYVLFLYNMGQVCALVLGMSLLFGSICCILSEEKYILRLDTAIFLSPLFIASLLWEVCAAASPYSHRRHPLPPHISKPLTSQRRNRHWHVPAHPL